MRDKIETRFVHGTMSVFTKKQHESREGKGTNVHLRVPLGLMRRLLMLAKIKLFINVDECHKDSETRIFALDDMRR